jgi:hypothetical protein
LDSGRRTGALLCCARILAAESNTATAEPGRHRAPRTGRTRQRAAPRALALTIGKAIVGAMKLPQPPPPPLTAAEFSTALREAGFGVEHARIVDVSGRCPGFVTTPVFRGRGGIDRNKTLAKAIRERDVEIAQRAPCGETASPWQPKPPQKPAQRVPLRGLPT